MEFNPHITSFIPIWCFIGTSFFRYELIHEEDGWLIRATTKHTMEELIRGTGG